MDPFYGYEMSEITKEFEEHHRYSLLQEIRKERNKYKELEKQNEVLSDTVNMLSPLIMEVHGLKTLNNELLEALDKISVCIKNTPAISDLDLLKLRTGEIDYLVNKIKGSGINE